MVNLWARLHKPPPYITSLVLSQNQKNILIDIEINKQIYQV